MKRLLSGMKALYWWSEEYDSHPIRRRVTIGGKKHLPIYKHHGGKVRNLVIDSGSCENVVSKEAVRKLGLETEKPPTLYRLEWFKKGNELMISKCCLVSFSIRAKYRDQVWCDVVAMDACHLLLGRPCQYDRVSLLDGRRIRTVSCLTT